MNQLELRLLALEKLTNEQAGYISNLSQELSDSKKEISEISGRLASLESKMSSSSRLKSAKTTK